MKKIVNKSYAKVNLSLDVLGKLDNGYHTIRTVFQTISLFDVVEVFRIREGIELSANIPYLPLDSGNIAYRAAEEFFKYTGIKNGVNINIAKRIPVGAGLAGGSSNASAVLKSMNELFETKLSLKELCSIGIKLGADVPYCVLGGTRLAEGIGDELYSLPRIPRCQILIVKPAFSVSTKSVYEKFDSCKNIAHPATQTLIHGLEAGDLSIMTSGMGNVLEAVTETEYPVISEIKEDLYQYGALIAQMSGSGPTVFAIFDNTTKAKIARQAMWEKYRTVYLCSPV